MKNRPLVSICCATYNHAPYIRDAIEGFLMQKTNFPFEIIINDDASTDGTTEIVKEYADKYPDLIVPIFQKENQYSKGFHPLSEFIIPVVRAKYIALCEGDDYWTDSLKLQKQFDFMEKNSGYSITYHDAKVVDDKGQTIEESALSKKFKKDFSRKELIESPNIPTCTKFFCNIDTSFKLDLKDSVLNSFLGNYGKGKYLSEIGKSAYRRHRGGVWTSRTKTQKRLGMVTSRLKLYELYIKLRKPKYIKFFRKKFNIYIYELIATTNFKSQPKIKKELFDTLEDNFDILTIQNKIFYKALSRNQEENPDMINKIYLLLVRLLIFINPKIVLAFIYWCKWKIGKTFKLKRIQKERNGGK